MWNLSFSKVCKTDFSLSYYSNIDIVSMCYHTQCVKVTIVYQEWSRVNVKIEHSYFKMFFNQLYCCLAYQMLSNQHALTQTWFPVPYSSTCTPACIDTVRAYKMQGCRVEILFHIFGGHSCWLFSGLTEEGRKK